INTAFWLLIVLLLAGVGLALWVASARSASAHRSDQLSAAKDRIAYDVVLISDTVRGLLLDPRNEPEKRRKHEAEADLASRLTFIQREYSQYPDLMHSVSNLLEFTSRTLNQFHDQVLATAESDPGGAIMLYNKDYPDIRDKRSKLFADLTYEIGREQNEEAMHGATLGWVGLAPFLIILLAIPIVGWVHSQTVTRPLNRLGAALERMRQGDFTERLPEQRRDEFGILSNGL